MYKQNPTADLEEQIEAEKKSMTKFEILFTDIQRQLKLTGDYEPTRIDFDCLSSSIRVVEAGCGRLSDYALQYVKFLADHCSHGGSAESF